MSDLILALFCKTESIYFTYMSLPLLAWQTKHIWNVGVLVTNIYLMLKIQCITNTLEKWIGHWGFILSRFQYFSAWKLLTWTWLRDASLVVATAALAATLARAASPFSRPRFTSRKTAGPSSWHAQLVPLVLIKPLKLGKNMKEYLPLPVFVPPIAQWCHALPCDIQFLKLWYSTRLHHHICSAWWARVTSTSRN